MDLPFGRWLKRRRVELRLTQAELARRMSYSVVTIRKIESEELRPSLQVTNRLADHLLIPVEDRPAFVRFARGEGGCAGFPPLPTLASRPNNLPRQPTALIGREQEVAAVDALLRKPEIALVTLTGPGGTGKTRLALQAAADLLDAFPAGVWVVDLAPLNDPALVIATIAATLGVTEQGTAPMVDTLSAYLKGKQALLVLDNFEPVVSAGVEVAALLRAALGVKVLVTSRMPLGVYGEHVYAVPPLSLPAAGQLPPLERLTQCEAVRLFVERAVAVRADFALSNANAPAVAEICMRLDGLPLAIELAAARIRLLGPEALLARLDGRLKLLTGGGRDQPARQQTLRGAIEWSYNLLSEGEQQLFRRLAVFQGGRTLEGLEAVCNYDGQLAVDVLEGVAALTSHSLLSVRAGAERGGNGGEPRFWMLETIHEYAGDRLAASGEGAALARAHAEYCLALAERAAPELRGAEQGVWLERLEAEHDNFRAALRWARAAGGGEQGAPEAAEIGLRIGGALWHFWELRGYLSEGREQLAGVLSYTPAAKGSARPDSGQARRARALGGAGVLAHRQGDNAAARSLSEASLTLWRKLGDKDGVASALHNLGIVARQQGDCTAARSRFEESLTLRREQGDNYGVGMSLHNLGIVAAMQGDHPLARSLSAQSLTLQRELGNQHGVALALNNLGSATYQQGDYPAARSLYEQSLSLQREIGNKHGVALALDNLGLVAIMRGDYPAARSLSEQSLTLWRELADKDGAGGSLHTLGLVAFMQGDYPAALSLYAQSLTLQREIGAKAGIASTLGALGGVVAALGQAEQGARLLGASDALFSAIGAVREPEGAIPYERGLAASRAVLREVEFAQAWQEGQALPLEAAIALALQVAGDA